MLMFNFMTITVTKVCFMIINTINTFVMFVIFTISTNHVLVKYD